VEGCVILVVALVLVAGIVAVATAITAFPAWLVWNGVVATVFGLPALTYTQTWAVLFVIGLLFGSVKFKSQEK
jgi:hypothetical protein